jgi:recombination protein RecA
MSVESWKDWLKKEYGEDISTTAHQVMAETEMIIPSLLSLDIALDGGIPQGSIVLLTGKEKLGKSSLALKIVSNAIDVYKSPALYLRVEVDRVTGNLLKTIEGLDEVAAKGMEVVPKKGIEKPLTAQNYLQIAERFIKEVKYGVVVIDTIAALSTQIEMTEDVGANKDMAGAPKLLHSFCRKVQQACFHNSTTLIFISHFQTHRDATSRKKTTEKGGLAPKQFCSVWISATWEQIWQTTDNKKNKDKKDQAPLGKDVHFSIKNSALGAPGKPCTIPFRYGKGYDRERDIIEQAINWGFIKKSGAWYEYEEEKVQGRDKLIKLIKDKDMIGELDRKIREMVIPNSLNRPECKL